MLILDEVSQLSIYQAKSHKEVIELFMEKKPAVVVLDSGLQGSSTANLLNQIKEVNEKTVVIILSIRINTLTKQKYAAADFLIDKYYEFQKIPALINAVAANRTSET